MRVCGYERVTLTDSSEWYRHTQLVEEPNFNIQLSDFDNMFTSNSTSCGIVSYELRASPNTPLAKSSPSWASWIKVNNNTNVIEVNHDQVVGSIENDTDISIYLMAISSG